jgi:phosphatidylglycerophosphate synthase
VIRDAALYLAGGGDLGASLGPIAGRPVAFRMLMAAVRAGAQRVYVPARFRGTAVAGAVDAVPSARAAAVWLDGGTPPPGPLLLLPAAALVPPAALRPLLTAGPLRRVRASRGSDAPVLTVTADVTRALWPALARGDALGDLVERAVAGAGVVDSDAGWYARLGSTRGTAAIERLLYAALGSAVDTGLDRVFHRRLSRPVTRLAVALGIGPNAITLGSLAIGLGAAFCFGHASPGLAGLGLALYATAVVLDHSDGEVARLTFAESAFGEWLDVAADTVVHAALVVALGVAAQSVAGGAGGLLGLVAAAGFIASALVAKTSPPASTPGLGSVLDGLGNRDGLYAMLLLFIAGLAVWPPALPFLMIVVAAGSHAFWVGRLALRLLTSRKARPDDRAATGEPPRTGVVTRRGSGR